MNSEIIEAIENMNVLEFYYKGHKRTVEPHCYGIHKDTGNEALCAYQIDGYSSSRSVPAWRLYLIPEMSGITIADEQFDKPRAGYKINDSRMSRIFYQLEI